MLAVGAGVLLAGYALIWYGFSLRAQNTNTISDLVIPGHYEKTHAKAKP